MSKKGPHPILLFGFWLLLLPSSSLGFSAPTAMPTFNSLGADALQKLVLEAAEHDVAQTMDVSGIVWLEHINLVVGSRPLAERFYLDLLGFSKDHSKSFHVNLGQQQFHLAATGDPAQRVTGSIGLAVPSVDRVRQRVVKALETEGEWKETQLAILQDKEDTLTLCCPWGNCLHLYDATLETKKLQPSSDSPHKMVNAHAQGGTYAPNRMAIRGGNPGIRFIEVACPLGTAPALAEFYRDMMGCTVSKPNNKSAVVCVGPGVHLVYNEKENLPMEDLEAMKGVHICIYVDRFQALYERLKAKNLIWTNPRFTHLDSCDTWEQAMASRTLRFKDLMDLGENQKVLELEHETRPMRHGQYMKVPFYEPK